MSQYLFTVLVEQVQVLPCCPMMLRARSVLCPISAILITISIVFAAIQSTCRENGDVALTFDLGPGPHTGKLLDELFIHKIPAAFHLSTDLFRNLTLTEYVRRAHLEGHAVGIFVAETALWVEAEELSENDATFTVHVVQQIMTASNWITSITGSAPRYVRFGSKKQLPVQLRRTVEQQLGLTITKPKIDISDEGNEVDSIWNSLSRGLAQATPQTNSFILCQRDTMSNSVASVEKIVEFVRERGFRIVPLPQCAPPRQSK